MSAPLQVTLELTDDQLTQLAERVALVLERRNPQTPPPSEWLDAAEAAAYMRASKQRVYDLTSSGRLRCAKDGSRSLFRREWLDAYLAPDERRGVVSRSTIEASPAGAGGTAPGSDHGGVISHG